MVRKILLAIILVAVLGGIFLFSGVRGVLIQRAQFDRLMEIVNDTEEIRKSRKKDMSATESKAYAQKFTKKIGKLNTLEVSGPIEPMKVQLLRFLRAEARYSYSVAGGVSSSDKWAAYALEVDEAGSTLSELIKAYNDAH